MSVRDTRMIYWYSLFFYSVFSFICTAIASGIFSISGFESKGEPLYLVSAQNKQLVLPFRIACLSRLMHDNTHTSSVKLDLSESLARKLVVLVRYAYGELIHERVTAPVQTAYRQITFEDIVQFSNSLDQLQFADDFNKIYAKLFVQKFSDISILTRCAEDKEYTQKLLARMPKEYKYLMLNVLYEQLGYLLWGPLHSIVNIGIDEAEDIPTMLNITTVYQVELECASIIKMITRAQDSRILLCYKFIKQGHIVVVVTSNQQTLYLEFYDVKNNVLLAQVTTIDMSSQESGYWLDVSPDMLKITLTTSCPNAEKARLLLGNYGSSQEIVAVVQTFDISAIVYLLTSTELFFLLICEYARTHDNSIDQAYVKYFLDDPLSILREAILRYSSRAHTNMSTLRRCSIS